MDVYRTWGMTVRNWIQTNQEASKPWHSKIKFIERSGIEPLMQLSKCDNIAFHVSDYQIEFKRVALLTFSYCSILPSCAVLRSIKSYYARQY